MNFGKRINADINWTPKISELFDARPANEDLLSFFGKLINKIKIACGNHKAMADYIKKNLDCFDKLKKDKVVYTSLPRDVSCVGNALQETNEALQKLRRGEKLDMAEVCSDTMEKAGVTYNSGFLSMVQFRHGKWGAGLKEDVDKPMKFHKTIEEFGWDEGARGYAERFVKLVEETSKSMLLASADRHFADMKKMMQHGATRDKQMDDKKVVVDQIQRLNAVRDTFINFFFKDLSAILKAAEEEPEGDEPEAHNLYVSDTFTGD